MIASGVAHLFVADVERPEIDADDLHHLTRVLRARSGEVVTVGDGAGAWRPCRFHAPATVEPVGPVVREAAPSPRTTVAFSLVKGERTDWAVQKLVEVGVDVVVILVTDRTVLRWDPDKAGRELQRFRRIARQAAMQSRRTWLADVRGPLDLAELAGAEPSVLGGDRPAVAGPRLAMAEAGGSPLTLEHSGVLVGPEGGWSPAELEMGFARVALGPTNLRTETAAVVAGALLNGLRAQLIAPAASK